MTSTDAEQFDGRLRVLGDARVDDAVARAADELAVSLEREQTRVDALREPHLRRRGRRGAVLAAGVFAAILTGAVAVPTVAVGEWIAARTGMFGDRSAGTESDTTEWLNLAGDDLPAIIAKAYPDGLTLPPSVEREEAVAKVDEIMARMGNEPNAYAQEGLLPQTYEFWAICAWYDEWLIADDLDDPERQRVASDWLGEPANFRSIAEHDGGGVIAFLLDFADGAERGERTVVERGYRAGACDSMLERTE